MKRVIWMFSGQGSQFYQMGHDLFATEPVFRRVMEEGDRVARRLLNISLIEEIYAAREQRFEPFRRLAYTHPAIVLTECALASVLLEKGFTPDALLGYSVGEVSSLVVAGSISLEEALTTVIKMAGVVEALAPRGGMTAVLDSVDLFYQRPEWFAGCEVAGRNSPKSFIVSAPEALHCRLATDLKAQGVSALELPVGYAFHSTAMSQVRTPVRAILQRLQPQPPCYPLISAAKGGPLREWDGAHLDDAIRQPVDFVNTIAQLEAAGGALYVDLGPSGSMATAVKYSIPQGASSSSGSPSEFFSVMTPYGQDGRHLARLIERLQQR